MLLPTISGCLRNDKMTAEDGKELLPTISGCLQFEETGSISTIAGIYRPLYRAVYVKLVWVDHHASNSLSPIISGCLHHGTKSLSYAKNFIAHYIGLSTTIFSVVFH